MILKIIRKFKCLERPQNSLSFIRKRTYPARFPASYMDEKGVQHVAIPGGCAKP